MQVDILFGTSRVRRELLMLFFAKPDTVRHVRELARETGWSATIVGRELANLERAGVLRSERIGNVRRYSVDVDSPVAAEVRSLVRKTIGVEARLRAALEGFAGLEEAFLYGSYARGNDRATSDLDVMVVGAIDPEDLASRLDGVERDLGRDVNPTAYTRRDLDRLLAEGDRFIQSVLSGPRVELVVPSRS